MDRTTVAVYEARARDWRAARVPKRLDRAQAFGAAVEPGGVRLDVGSGPGSHLAALGEPVVALDASFSMLELAREAAPGAGLVHGDLERLPFRRGAIRGAWARASYLHVPRARLPWALMELHQALAVDAPIDLTLRSGTNEGELSGDDFPGRWFAEWTPDALGDVLVGAGFAVEQCDLALDAAEWVHVRATRARTLPDYVGPGLRVLLCGLNPSEYAADVGVGFARPGNRFWPAALAAGILTRDRDPRDALLSHSIGMTDLVKRATPRADALSREEYRDGAARLERLVRWLAPRVVCFVGLSGYRAAIDKRASSGRQADFGDAATYVMPNPSGVNGHVTVDDLADHLRAAAALAA